MYLSLGRQLLLNYPYIYSSGVGESVKGHYPVLELAMKGVSPPPSKTWTRETPLVSHKGLIFTSFAKFTKFGKGDQLFF